MPFGNTYGNDILQFTINSVAFNVAYTASLYHEPHTADPGIDGDQSVQGALRGAGKSVALRGG